MQNTPVMLPMALQMSPGFQCWQNLRRAIEWRHAQGLPCASIEAHPALAELLPRTIYGVPVSADSSLIEGCANISSEKRTTFPA